MECTQRADGEYVFTRRIHIAPGREYQFKFRKGDHDWVLDENSRIVTDSFGNQNNILCVDSNSTPKTTHHVPGKVLNELGIVAMDDRRSDTPIEQVATTAAEVAETAQLIDQDDEHSDADDEGEYSPESQEAVQTPLFAHECLGGYAFVDDGLDHAEIDEPLSSLRQSRSVTRDLTLEEVDINDPTIEKFPSERGSVMDVLRKVQSSSSADNVQIDSALLSPSIASRKSSVDSTADELTETLSPTSPTSSRRRENRPSYSSFHKTKSAVSLDSIAEEPKPAEGDSKGPRPPIFNAPVTPPSDEDHGVFMRETKVEPPGLSEETLCPCPKEQLSKQATGHKASEGEPNLPYTGAPGLEKPNFPRKNRREKVPLLSECDEDCISFEKQHVFEQMDNPRTHAVPGNDRAALTTIGLITVALAIGWWKGHRLVFR